MRVFISWSGPKSRLVAAELHEWLDGPLNDIQTFMSQEDIAAGENWSAMIDEGLDNALFGIICTTPDNQSEPWLNYEAGAIAKAVNGVQARVVPLLIDFSDPTELVGPLKKFQAKKADKDGIFSIVRSINAVLDRQRDSIKLDSALEDMWPRLERRLEEIDAAKPAAKETRRTEKDMVTEILGTVRDIARKLPDSGNAAAPAVLRAATRSELVEIRQIITAEFDQSMPYLKFQLRHRASNHTITILSDLSVPVEIQSKIRASILEDFESVLKVSFVQEDID